MFYTALIFLTAPVKETLFPFLEEASKKELPPFSEQLEKMVFYLIIALILLFVSLYLLKKFQTKSTEKKNFDSLIKIVESRSLSPKTTLHLVEIQGKGILFTEGETEVTALTSFPLHPILPESSQGDSPL